MTGLRKVYLGDYGSVIVHQAPWEIAAMKMIRTTIILAFGAFLIFAAPNADAGPGLKLSEDIKAGLMGMRAVKDKPVTPEFFDGKPTMVIFFASW
jgi:hypothetical protein